MIGLAVCGSMRPLGISRGFFICPRPLVVVRSLVWRLGWSDGRVFSGGVGFPRPFSGLLMDARIGMALASRWWFPMGGFDGVPRQRVGTIETPPLGPKRIERSICLAPGINVWAWDRLQVRWRGETLCVLAYGLGRCGLVGAWGVVPRKAWASNPPNPGRPPGHAMLPPSMAERGPRSSPTSGPTPHSWRVHPTSRRRPTRADRRPPERRSQPTSELPRIGENISSRAILFFSVAVASTAQRYHAPMRPGQCIHAGTHQ